MTDDDFTDLYATVAKLNNWLGRPGDTGQFRIRTLLAIEKWALDQLHVHTGDRVEVHGVVSRLHPAHGWWGHRDTLADGNPGTVIDVDYNAVHEHWQCDVTFDSDPNKLFAISPERLKVVAADRGAA